MDAADKKEFDFVKDSLDGCITRLCVSDDVFEINLMKHYAITYILRMARFRILELSDSDIT